MRLAALPILLAGLFAAAWGVWGTYVVFRDWLPCVDQSGTPLGDYPGNYCGLIDWRFQFGVGVALVVAGVAGVLAARWLLRRADATNPAPAQPAAG
jgi:hypothetical protein